MPVNMIRFNINIFCMTGAWLLSILQMVFGDITEDTSLGLEENTNLDSMSGGKGIAFVAMVTLGALFGLVGMGFTVWMTYRYMKRHYSYRPHPSNAIDIKRFTEDA